MAIATLRNRAEGSIRMLFATIFIVVVSKKFANVFKVYVCKPSLAP